LIKNISTNFIVLAADRNIVILIYCTSTRMEKIRFPVTKPALNWAEIGLKPIYEDQQHKSRKRSVVGFVCAVPHSPLFRVATESSMGRIGSPLGKNEFSWVIKDFSSLGVRAIYSDEFVIGGCKW